MAKTTKNEVSAQQPLIEAALKVAKLYPVFPLTGDKKPAWSNAELRVKPGQGAFKIAAQDPHQVRKLFGHRRAKMIGVPTGSVTKLLVIDFDFRKSPEAQEWLDENKGRVPKTRIHCTMNGVTWSCC